ncbi:MAG: hypothetical protein ABIH08_05035 [Candidatus Omnitrophota bacterium]
MELYGTLGTLESRRKGGVASQKKFREDSIYAKKVGFILRKKVKYPDKSSLLAEFTGIMVGDGNVRGDYQIAIAFNGKKDQDYAPHIQGMIKKLFSIQSSRHMRKENGGADIVVSGKNLVEFLERLGIKKGNKAANQINIPNWIFEHREYQIACLQGFF